jgi:preprotein translocase subunit SecE
MGSVDQYKAINWLNLAKWLFVFVILVAGIVGNSLFDKDYSVIVRAAVMLLLVVVAAAIAISTEQGATFWRLVKESRAEVRRVVWPTRQETWQTTLVVGLVVLVTALFLWCLDWLLNLSISWLVG